MHNSNSIPLVPITFRFNLNLEVDVGLSLDYFVKNAFTLQDFVGSHSHDEKRKHFE